MQGTVEPEEKMPQPADDGASARPAAGPTQRGASGEGSRTALARLIEQERSRGRTQPQSEPDSSDGPAT
jgi:hypothetical protein